MDDFDREIYCLAGLPFDAVDMAGAVQGVHTAVAARKPCFLSTPNLNFLIGCQDDPAFRDSVIHSDLSVVDGMPLVWMARLLRIPIRERVAGSGLFEALWLKGGGSSARLSVYFLGGPEGVAERACQALNEKSSGLSCTGFQCPGFGGVEEMSGEETIALINAGAADILVVALGARKGQAWIERNRNQLNVPVISHLGAVVNFVAGTVDRAPLWMQRTGLEWLWRIKEEPALWQRYWNDGTAFIGLMMRRVLPYSFWLRFGKGRFAGHPGSVSLQQTDDKAWARIRVEGAIPEVLPETVRKALRDAAAMDKDLELDLSRAEILSPAFFGLLLMLKKNQDSHRKKLRICNVSGYMRRLFYWNGVDYLLIQNG